VEILKWAAIALGASALVIVIAATLFFWFLYYVDFDPD